MGSVDELSMIVYPGLDGESGLSFLVIECQGVVEPLKKNRLELIHCETVGSGYVWLRYNIFDR